MSVYGNLVVIGANTEIDPEDSVTITVKVLQNDGSVISDISDRTFTASLICEEDACNYDLGDKSPDLIQTNPICADLIEGVVHENEFEDIWFVPKQFYRLVRVEMWKNRINTSGFRVIYKRPDTEYF